MLILLILPTGILTAFLICPLLYSLLSRTSTISAPFAASSFAFCGLICPMDRMSLGIMIMPAATANNIIVLLSMREPTTEQRMIITFRYVLRGQLIIFCLYMIVVVGILHQLEVTPWSFLLVFLLLIMFPDRTGGWLSFMFIAAMFLAMLMTHSGLFDEHRDYLVRFFFSLIVFTGLSFCSGLLRTSYLIRNKEATQKLKKSEVTHRELSKQLMAEIKQRDEIQEKLHRAIKMEVAGKMAAGVAHDLNNILSGLVTYPDLLLMDLDKKDPNRKPLEIIKNSGIKAAAIVEDMLTISRKAVSVREAVDLKNIVEDYLSSPEHYQYSAISPKIEIVKEYDPNRLNVSGSSIHLSKMVMNLVVNAIEAMPDGGKIRIIISTKRTEGFQTVYDKIPTGEYTIFSISDTGIGIKNEEIEKICEPFYTKKMMGRSGTGLGMAVVQGVVKDHKAFMDVDSKVGHGTVFSIYFPVTKAEVVNKKENEITPVYGNKERIMVIDDVPDQLKIACDILLRLDYRAKGFLSGELALEELKSEKYDLLVIDMMMEPGMDGFETYKAALKINPEQKAMIATGYSDAGKLNGMKKLGAVECLNKPYSLSTLGIKVRSALDQ